MLNTILFQCIISIKDFRPFWILFSLHDSFCVPEKSSLRDFVINDIYLNRLYIFGARHLNSVSMMPFRNINVRRPFREPLLLFTLSSRSSWAPYCNCIRNVNPVLFFFSEGESSMQSRDWATIQQPSSINDLPEKLLMSGITFPGKPLFFL